MPRRLNPVRRSTLVLACAALVGVAAPGCTTTYTESEMEAMEDAEFRDRDRLEACSANVDCLEVAPPCLDDGTGCDPVLVGPDG